jgi:Protein of unknown function (DUF3606)
MSATPPEPGVPLADENIDIFDESQIECWSKRLHIGTDGLREAIMSFGPSASGIRRIQASVAAARVASGLS